MPEPRLRIALLARSVHPLHGVGGLERHVYDLVRHLIAEGAHVTLITKPPTRRPGVPVNEAAAARHPAEHAANAAGADRAADTAVAADTADSLAAADRFGVPRDAFRLITVPYVTFPGAGRRWTTVIDRATAYPLFGWRAGRVAADLARRGEVDIVHALGASGLGYARARRGEARDHDTSAHGARPDAGADADRHGGLVPFVFNPQGLEEFGATDPGRARLKRTAYRPLQMAVRACARAADVVLATDRALVPTVLRHLPVDASRVEVIPNAIDLAAIDQRRDPAAAAAVRARAGLDPDTPVLLSVGRLEENKGFHVAARALGALLRRQEDASPDTSPDARRPASTHESAGPSREPRRGGVQDAPSPSGSAGLEPRTAASAWRWVLIGDGPYRAAIERAAAEAGLGSRMIVAGRAPDADLHAWYETAALFVHPTLYEGSSLVTLEAMAHERPVVATRAGGLPDKVFPGVNGWLVEPDRADQLADALAEAMTAAPATRAAMGRAGRGIVEREFAWPAVAARLMTLYRHMQRSRG